MVKVVFSSDNNYAPYLGVAIKSLIDNSSDKNNYSISILDGGISDYNKLKIDRLVINKNNISIEFIDIKKYLESYDLSIFNIGAHFSVAAYYRFFIPEIFKYEDKILYLDCDMVFLFDVAELYEKESSNSILAAKDVEVIRSITNNDLNYKNYVKIGLGIKNYKKYFNSGLMIMNLKKMRNNNYLDSLINKLKEVKKPWFVDQCILNAVYNDDVEILDRVYNYQWHTKIFADKDKLKDQMSEEDYKDFLKASKNPKVVHYTSHIKPWNEIQHEYAETFWLYARSTEFYEELLEKRLNISNQPVANDELTNSHSLPKEVRKVHRKKYKLYKLAAKVTFGRLKKKFKQKRKHHKYHMERV
tara:strand:+ start:4474 stop:5547 length:1074 start_codon:yes stop_codon:yes gene_type:complete